MKSSNNKENVESNDNSSTSKGNECPSITEITSIKTIAIKNNDILDKIAGDYLIRPSDGETPQGTGFVIVKESDGTYTIMEYQTHAGGFTSEKIIGLVK